MDRKWIVIFSVGVIILLGVILQNSKSRFKEHESGLQYRLFIENKEAEQANLGDVVAIKYRLLNSDGIQIEESPMFRTQMKEASHPGGSVEDALSLLHVGDSGVFLIKANDYFRVSKKTDVPSNVDPESKVELHIKMADVISINEFEKERQATKIFGEREEEQILKDYLKRANITKEPSVSGLYYIEERKGNGKKPTPGKKVSVHYLGYFVDGQIFDSSYERSEPFDFVLGVGQVIQGWEEGISQMRVGGKAKLIIPSYLAYGSKQTGPIPPYATLIFEVELLAAQ